MAIVVNTQYIENYGVWDETYSNIWKFKGGQTFVVWGTDRRPANAVALVAEYIYQKPMGIRSTEFDKNFSFEFPTHWEFQPDNYLDDEILDLGSEVRYLQFRKDNLHDYKERDFGKVLSTWAGGYE